jgi:LPXTG-motif cell wall-anchored protein
MAMPNTGAMVARSMRKGGGDHGPEGGGGDYGGNSGGFDELGFGTLAFTQDKASAAESAATPPGSAPTPVAKSGSSGSSSSSGSSGSSGDSAAVPPSGPSARAGKSDGDLAATGSSDLPLWTAASGITALAGGLLLLRRRGRAAATPSDTEE